MPVTTSTQSESDAALRFLSSPPMSLDLSSISQLGGHSYPRTHCNTQGPNVGTVLTSSLKKVLESMSSVTFLPNNAATSLTTDQTGAVTGVTLRNATDGAERHLSAAGVILATGGFAANREMLQKFAPPTAKYATTSGAQATGEGI